VLSISQSGSVVNAAQALRAVPSSIIPYAAAAALTATAKAAQQRIKADMPSVFQAPTRYTLNALRIEPATARKLTARVAVKDRVASGTRPESYLLPEVRGGQRSAKGLEGALRYAGVLGPGQFAVPGAGMQLDSYGNAPRSAVRGLLTALRGLNSQAKPRGRRRRARKNDYFVGKPAGRSRPAGIWKREGRKFSALFIFTDRPPVYRRRLDFEGVAAQVAKDRFEDEFFAVADRIQRRTAK